jgi:hypothetical protein
VVWSAASFRRFFPHERQLGGRPDIMSDTDETLDLESVSTGDRPPTIPDEIPILPLRDTVLFPNSFMPLAVARRVRFDSSTRPFPAAS